MQKVFYVENGDLFDVNRELQKGGTVKQIQVITTNITTGYAHNEYRPDDYDYVNSKVCAYIVVEL